MRTAGAALTVSARFCVAVCTGVPLSVTTAVSVNEPAAVGVPVMAPVDALIAKPSLLVEARGEYLYGGVPPVAPTVCE